MKLALYQGPGVINSPDAAFALMETKATEARANGARLLLFPEMYVSGYNIGAEAARRHALAPADLAPAQKIAQSLGMGLAFGYPERVGDQVANAAVLIDATGTVLLNYRKSHPCREYDRAMFDVTGREFPLATVGGAKLGLLICKDIEFPEPARRLALAGADLILVPAAQTPPYDPVARHVIPARAYENQVYVAYANRTGAEHGLDYIGQSSICGPDGAVLAMAGQGEELLFASTDAAHHAAIRRADTLLADRRPDLYAPLAKP
ncbi:MAG TPA: carbon-nitrogen hydrolase family protein [Acidocella sp.]|jgi:predicted amidohydrolase|uniref:carbon-nitrogen hydrolase family protein n=1 Tax=Acidocella sp. TaxID=50710 RepID=UPI002C002939|nr:carbon-nitrogen hydrolase family protein [Acidocella sp.]HVE21587.1 carbon-nitrogen hydrolase family protein [Acidocella sp.]